MTESVGFIGLGNMGAPLARRLHGSGRQLFVHDVNPAATAPFATLDGVAVCASLREVAENAGVVLLSLPTPSVLEAVALGADGIASAAARPCVIDLSTSGVAASRAVATALSARGFDFLDAPVSGGVYGAERGILAVMVAGDGGLYEAYRELLAVLGKNVFYVGAEPGMGQAMKLVNNVLSATALAATAEAMAVATKAGIDPAVALDILNVSSGRNSATEEKFPREVISGRFAAGFQTRLLLKDVKLFEELAEALAAPTLVCAATVNAWRLAVTQGYGEQDITTFARLIESLAGVEIRARGAAREIST